MNKKLQLVALSFFGAFGVVYVTVLAFVYAAIAGPSTLNQAPLLSAMVLVLPVSLLLTPAFFLASKFIAADLRGQLQDVILVGARKANVSIATAEELEQGSRSVLNLAIASVAITLLGLPLAYAIVAGFIGRLLSIHWLAALGGIAVLAMLVAYFLLKRKYGSLRTLIRRFLMRQARGHVNAH